jgi:hypothetical protein
MAEYRNIYSSNNPIEIDQVKMAFERANIDYKVIGEQALLTGNVELTGITGAYIKVLDSDYIHATKLMKEIGFDTESDSNSQGFSTTTIIGITLLLILVTLLMYCLFS